MSIRYYSWDQAVDDDEIERLIQDCETSELQEAKIGGVEVPSVCDNSIRKTGITWVKATRLLNRAMWSFLTEANENYFKFCLSGHEPIQYAKYLEGEFYTWHMDAANKKPDEKYIRKLTAVMLLSDPTDYEGGKLEFYAGSDDPTPSPISKKGSVVVFDSNAWHRVEPVTKGVRRTLVMWAVGPQFR